jgi:hypothetical protein
VELHGQLQERFGVNPSEMSIVAVALALSHAEGGTEGLEWLENVPSHFQPSFLDAACLHINS